MKAIFLSKRTKSLRAATTISMITLIVLSALALSPPQVKAQGTRSPLEVAEKAAEWLVDQAIPEGDGYKWEHYTSLETLFYQSSMPQGAAGIGFFFLSLYEKTNNLTYLHYAEGAAKWIISQAVSELGGYKWPHADDGRSDWWLSPDVSGIGEFLLKLYQTTDNSTFLDYAVGAAQWLAANVEYEYGGSFIPYNPPGKYGSQASHGIQPGREARTVSYLLHLYQETANSSYLTYVQGTARWLMDAPYKETENGGYRWRLNYPYTAYYHLHSMSEIALFFYEIYEAFGSEVYLEHANGAVQWLLSQAISVDDTYVWPDQPGSTQVRLLPFAGSYYGVEAKVNDLLLVAFSITKNVTFLEFARRHADRVVNLAVEDGEGYKFPFYDGGSRYNAYENARVYNFLSWMYNMTGEVVYSSYANGTLAWIIDNSTATDGGYKWRTVSSFPYYQTLFSTGAAGVGYYLNSAPPPLEVGVLTSLPAGSKNIDPTILLLDDTKLLIEVSIEGLGQSANVSAGQTVSANATYQVYALNDPNETNQGFFIMSWTPSWPAPLGYYIPIWNGTSDLYPGTGQRTESFSFTAPSTPGTYYLYWCSGTMPSTQDAVNMYSQSLTLPAHAKIVVPSSDVPPSFELVISPKTQLGLDFAESINLNISISSKNGFNSSVELSVSRLPDVATSFLGETSILPDGTSTLEIRTFWSTRLGKHIISVSGSSGNIYRQKNITLWVDGLRPFDLSTAPSLLVYVGESVRAPIEIMDRRGNFDFPIDLHIEGNPTYLRASFSNNHIWPTENSTMTLSALSNASQGLHQLTLVATSQNYSRKFLFSLEVKSPPPPFVIWPISPLSVNRGESVLVDVVVETRSGFSLPIILSTRHEPEDLTISLSENIIIPGQNSTITISASSEATQGLRNFELVGTSENFSYSITITVSVEVQPIPVLMERWLWILLAGVAGIVFSSSLVQHYYKKWKKTKMPLDLSYLTAAGSLAKLEELRLLGKISEKDYLKLKREYERMLK